MLANPAMANSATAASEPPVTAASRYPCLMARNASPMAWLPEAQAVTVQKFAPLNLF